MPDYKLLGIKKVMIIAKTWEDSSFWVKGEGGGWKRRLDTGGSVAIAARFSHKMPVLPQNAPNTYDSHTP